MEEFSPWPLEPHSAAKHTLLKLYLDRWFPILGKYHQSINYVDGFAGPGEYSGGEKGSPVLAIESAIEHVNRKTLPSNVRVNFVFVESNKKHATHLKQQLAKMALPQQFTIEVNDGTFCDTMNDFLDRIDSQKKSPPPTLAFVDPFGFSGIPMSLMARILKYPRCEVFINIMVEFINRFILHPNAGVTSHLSETFGTSDVFDIPNLDGTRLEQLLSLYRRQLRQHAKFVGRFDMHGRRDQKTYSLFFATNASKGFEKMKEAMWAVDKTSGSLFSDAHSKARSLFESMGFEPLWDDLQRQFSSQSVPMSELERFVIEETDYLPTHARQILKRREETEEILVHTQPGCERQGKTFPNDKVIIEFRC